MTMDSNAKLGDVLNTVLDELISSKQFNTTEKKLIQNHRDYILYEASQYVAGMSDLEVFEQEALQDYSRMQRDTEINEEPDPITGDLTYTPSADANGSATITLNLTDDGGTTNGGVDTSADQNFTINVTAVNDVPSFTVGANETVLEDAGAQTINSWATAISAGPADEATQILSFNITNNSNPALFAATPLVDASGNLIKDPETADRNYDTQDDNSNNETDNNYYKFCGYYSVPYEGGPFKRNN